MFLRRFLNINELMFLGCSEAEVLFLGCLKFCWTDPPPCAECPPWVDQPSKMAKLAEQLYAKRYQVTRLTT